MRPWPGCRCRGTRDARSSSGTAAGRPKSPADPRGRSFVSRDHKVLRTLAPMSVRRAASNVPDPAVEISLLAGGEVAFARIQRNINEARTRIYLRCFIWRDNKTDDTETQAQQRAAERGVKITILKDRVG